jgi:hypothetical protein
MTEAALGDATIKGRGSTHAVQSRFLGSLQLAFSG